jgi:hypothetical protein
MVTWTKVSLGGTEDVFNHQKSRVPSGVHNETAKFERRTVMKILKTETQDSVQRGSERSSRPTMAFYSNVPERSMNQDIAKLAYALWQQRGYPYGSPEFDWFEAERTLSGAPKMSRVDL